MDKGRPVKPHASGGDSWGNVTTTPPAGDVRELIERLRRHAYSDGYDRGALILEAADTLQRFAAALEEIADMGGDLAADG